MMLKEEDTYSEETFEKIIGDIVYNKGRVSKWRRLCEKQKLLKILCPGDLVEFNREGYYHWAVFIGHTEHDGHSGHIGHCGHSGDAGDAQCQLRDCDLKDGFIIHRANPIDQNNSNNLIWGSRCLNKGVYGIGDVTLEPLDVIWGNSEARINNSKDLTVDPFTAQDIVNRALQVVHGKTRQCGLPYNLLTNNCEHFSSWCRNGWSVSKQVKQGGGKLISYGLTSVADSSPGKTLAIAGQMCLAGAKMMIQERRM